MEMEQELYLYYSTQRPVDIGTYPKPSDNPPIEIKNFDTRIPVEDGTFMAWGTITYAKPLSTEDAGNHELRSSRENPDVRKVLAEQLPVVGAWEERSKIAPVKRVTRWDAEAKMYQLEIRATPLHLAEQYRRALKFPDWKEPFYRTFHPNDKLEPGVHIELCRNVEFDPWRAELSNVAELVKLSPEELEKKRQDSAAKEQEILSAIQESLSQWEKQAAQTLQVDKALEYVRTPAVSHTSNEWQQRKDGSWVISNLVYTMEYKIWEDEAGDKKGTWLVSWELGINCPARPDAEKYYFAGERVIAEQNKKRYDTFEAAQKYIQGRFDLYVELFRELRPPVPDKFKRHFYINGCLLPEYTVAPPELTTPDAKAVESLLDYLDEGDTAPPPPAAPVDPAPQSPAKPQKPTAPPTAGRPKRSPAKPKPKRKSSMSR